MLIGFSIEDGLRTLCAWLCQLIYQLIAGLFELFINVSKVEILSSNNIEPIYQRVTTVLAIVMVFYVTFELVKYIVQPDQMTDKEKGASKVVSKMIIVVLLIAFVPKVFSYAYKAQNIVIEKEILSKVILGESGTDVDHYGRNFSADVFSLFYQYDKDFWNDEKGTASCGDIACNDIVVGNINNLREDGKLTNLTYELNKNDKETKRGVTTKYYRITFNGLLAVIVGGFLLYILVLFCIDIGTRVAQLVFLQVIAPIPIIGYLSPKKENIFTKWVKQCLTTYLDLFIRLAIIYFILLIVKIITVAYNDGTLFNNIPATSSTTLIYIVLILGLLLFAQKAPKMLQELFPKMGAASGNFGLKAGERVAPAAARTIGAGVGLARGVVGGAIRRNRWRTERNKANGWSTGFSRFTKEGRENNRQKKEEEKLHRQELRQNRRKHQNLVDNEKQKRDFDAARDAWKDTVNKNGKIKDLNKRIKEAHDRGDSAEARRLGAELQKEYRTLQNTDEYKKWNEARKAMGTSAFANDMRRQNRDNTDDLKDAREKETEARNRLAEAIASGDQSRIDKEQKNVAEASENVRAIEEKMQQQQKDNKALFSGNYDEQLSEAKQNLERASEQVYDDKNTSFKGFAGSAVSTAAGAVRVGLTGARATKLGDIHKQVQQGVKNDIASVKAVQKYYDDGGTGWVDRTIQQVEKNIGMPTAYERTVLQNHALEPKIKRLEAQSALTSDVKATADGAEDRLKDKINDLKLSAVGRTIKTVDENGQETNVQVQPGETLGAVYRRYQGMEAKAQTDAETAAKRLDDFRANNPSVSIPDGFTGPLTSEQQQLKALQDDANKKATQASNAKYATTLVHKNAARAEFSAILKEFATRGVTDKASADIRATGDYENVAVEKVYDALKSLEVARSNPEVVEGIRINLGNNVAAFNAFMTGNISDFDTLDKIKTAAINAGNTYNREAKATKEAKRSSETSNKTSAQKAAQDYNPGGGKK